MKFKILTIIASFLLWAFTTPKEDIQTSVGVEVMPDLSAIFLPNNIFLVLASVLTVSVIYECLEKLIIAKYRTIKFNRAIKNKKFHDMTVDLKDFLKVNSSHKGISFHNVNFCNGVIMASQCNFHSPKITKSNGVAVNVNSGAVVFTKENSVFFTDCEFDNCYFDLVTFFADRQLIDNFQIGTFYADT